MTAYLLCNDFRFLIRFFLSALAGLYSFLCIVTSSSDSFDSHLINDATDRCTDRACVCVYQSVMQRMLCLEMFE